MYGKSIVDQLRGLESPFYLYNLDLLTDTLDKCSQAASQHKYHVHYALKANSNPEILKHISSRGFGADCVSGNEVTAAMKCGFPAEAIAFAGVGKTDKEINTALSAGIFSFNVESGTELDIIDELAWKAGVKANIALRINPNVNARTHEYITTGLEENKFGINTWELPDVISKLNSLKNITFRGLHFHIGSQITELSVFKGLCVRINELQRYFIDRHLVPEHINVGGGLGVEYEHPDGTLVPDFRAFFRVFSDHLELRPGQNLHFELGRSLVAQCGSLITRVLYIKKGINVNFAIMDAGMTELIRPALYQSYHKIESLEGKSGNPVRYDVVGPICESSDCFGKSVMLTELERKDMVAIRTTGAYGEVMSSSYNLRDKAPAYYIADGKIKL